MDLANRKYFWRWLVEETPFFLEFSIFLRKKGLSVREWVKRKEEFSFLSTKFLYIHTSLLISKNKKLEKDWMVYAHANLIKYNDKRLDSILFAVFDLETTQEVFEEKHTSHRVKTRTNTLIPYAISYRCFILHDCVLKENVFVFPFRCGGDVENLPFYNHVDIILKYFDTKIEERRVSTLYLFAHNFRGFDGYFLIPALLRDKVQKLISMPNVIYRDGKWYKVSFTFLERGRKVVIFCRYLLLRRSLNNLSERFLGLNVGKELFPSSAKITWSILESNYISLEDRKISPDEYKLFMEKLYKEQKTILDLALSYCQHDSFLLAKILQVFINLLITDSEFKNINISPDFLITAPILAQKHFFKKYYIPSEYPISILPPSGSLRKLIRKSFCGGRTEVFNLFFNLDQKENKFLYHYDIPGIYRKAMSMHLPYGSPVYVSHPNFKISDFKSFLEKLHSIGMCGFFHVMIESPSRDEMWLPILPYKRRNIVGNKLVFPCGNWRYYYYSKELLKALEFGYVVVAVYDGVIYKSGPILKEFASRLTTKKAIAKTSKNKPLESLWKLLINSLYGKIAQKEIFTKTELFKNNVALVNLQLKHVDFQMLDLIYFFNMSCGAVVFEKQNRSLNKQELWGRKSSIAIGAAITAEARVLLFSCIQRLFKIEGFSNLIYTDTDSFFITSYKNPYEFKLFENDSFTLKWDSNDVYRKGVFLATKLYYAEGYENTKNKIAHKGIGVKFHDPILNQIKINQEYHIGQIMRVEVEMFRKKILGSFMMNIETITKEFQLFNDFKRELLKIERNPLAPRGETRPLIIRELKAQEKRSINSFNRVNIKQFSNLYNWLNNITFENILIKRREKSCSLYDFTLIFKRKTRNIGDGIDSIHITVNISRSSLGIEKLRIYACICYIIIIILSFRKTLSCDYMQVSIILNHKYWSMHYPSTFRTITPHVITGLPMLVEIGPKNWVETFISRFSEITEKYFEFSMIDISIISFEVSCERVRTIWEYDANFNFKIDNVLLKSSLKETWDNLYKQSIIEQEDSSFW